MASRPRLPVRNIGVVTTSFPRHEGDYAGSFVLNYVETLRRAGHSVEVIAPAAAGSGPHQAWLEAQSLTLLESGSETFNPFYASGVPENLRKRPYTALGLLRFGHALRAELSSRQWDIQINHWTFPFGFLRAPGTQQLGIFHSADLFALERSPARRQLARALARRLDGFHFVTQQQRDRFKNLVSVELGETLNKKSTVCPMPSSVDSGDLPRAHLREQLQLDRPTVLVLGRLVSIKAVDRAISALKHLPDFHLVIAGSGPEQSRLEKLANAFGDRVRFIGELPRSQVGRWLHASDALLVPSRTTRLGRSEGMPTVISEARATGCPVVTTVQQAGETFRTDPSVIVVDAPSAAALAEALERALKRKREVFQLSTMTSLAREHLRLLS